MNIHKLDKLLNPRRIALIGVTINPNSVGGKVLSNLVGGGFNGVVYPVSPTAEAQMGVACYPEISSLPRNPDNPRMIHLFKNRNFKMEYPPGGSVVDVEKEL